MKELGYLLDELCENPKSLDQARRFLRKSLPKDKYYYGSRKSKGNYLDHCYKDFIKYLGRPIRLTLRLKKKQGLLFFRQNIELHSNRIILTQAVQPDHRKIYHFNRNLCYIALNCGTVRSNYVA